VIHEIIDGLSSQGRKRKKAEMIAEFSGELCLSSGLTSLAQYPGNHNRLVAISGGREFPGRLGRQFKNRTIQAGVNSLAVSAASSRTGRYRPVSGSWMAN
jgi:hypothetical protein